MHPDDDDASYEDVYVCLFCGHEDVSDAFGQFCPMCGTDLSEFDEEPPMTDHAELEQSLTEQARLVGMGAEREAALLAKVAELERQRDAMFLRAREWAEKFGDAERSLAVAKRDVATERALQRAAKVLPDGWIVRVEVERGAGWVDLSAPDGTEHTSGLLDADDTLAESINRAIDAAMAREGEVGKCLNG